MISHNNHNKKIQLKNKHNNNNNKQIKNKLKLNPPAHSPPLQRKNWQRKTRKKINR